MEVAIEDMRDKINKLKEVLSNAQDTKLLQMQLQGGIATSVNQGPYAIAHAFLGAVPASEQNHFHQQLRMCFREFVKLYVSQMCDTELCYVKLRPFLAGNLTCIATLVWFNQDTKLASYIDK